MFPIYSNNDQKTTSMRRKKPIAKKTSKKRQMTNSLKEDRIDATKAIASDL